MEETPRPSQQEFWLLKLLLLNDEHAGWVAAHLRTEWLPNALVRHIITRRFVAHTADEWHGAAGFLAEFQDTPTAANLITEVLSDARTVPNAEQQLRDIVLRLRNQFLDRQLAALTQQISHPETSEARRLELLHQQQALREAKRQPLAPLGED